MKTISRYLMTLALLLTAATGAWADSFSTEAYTADATLSAVSVTGNTTLTINEGVTVTVNNGLTINSGATLTVTGGGSLAVNGATGANGGDGNSPGADGSTAIGGSGQLAIANATITATGGAGGNGGYDEYCSQWGGDGAPAVSGVSISIQTGSLTAIGGAGGIGGTSTVYHQKYDDGATAKAFSSFPNISDATLSYSTDNVTYTKYESGNTTLYRYMKIEPPAGPAVTTNAASKQDLFTEASFEMPTYDVTVNYTLVRDMTVDVDATIAERIRIKKENNAYVAVTATELIPAVSDKISGTAVAMTATTDYTAQLQKKTEGDTPTWADATTLSVGTFRYVITGTGLYDGNITTNEFQLFEGYEVTVPAGEYATYFKDEALYVENENAQLYTISSVTESEAVLSDAITVAPANTPLLVYNKSEQDKTFLLIPATEDADAVTPASQFKGTLEAASIPASTSTQDNYALNGKAFVWVKNALNISANKCWLQINYQLASTRANTRSIVGGNGTTGIDAATSDDNEGDYYDLQGRKVEKPNRKGIYIHNGKKVIVR